MDVCLEEVSKVESSFLCLANRSKEDFLQTCEAQFHPVLLFFCDEKTYFVFHLVKMNISMKPFS